jgi:hypothetical protein
MTRGQDSIPDSERGFVDVGSEASVGRWGELFLPSLLSELTGTDRRDERSAARWHRNLYKTVVNVTGCQLSGWSSFPRIEMG